MWRPADALPSKLHMLVDVAVLAVRVLLGRNAGGDQMQLGTAHAPLARDAVGEGMHFGEFPRSTDTS